MCPKYERAMHLLGKRWTGLIIRALMGGPQRFKDLRQQMPQLGDRILCQRLKELESEGVILRKVHDVRPVRVEYSLAQKGRDMESVVESIQAWAEKHM